MCCSGARLSDADLPDLLDRECILQHRLSEKLYKVELAAIPSVITYNHRNIRRGATVIVKGLEHFGYAIDLLGRSFNGNPLINEAGIMVTLGANPGILVLRSDKKSTYQHPTLIIPCSHERQHVRFMCYACTDADFRVSKGALERLERDISSYWDSHEIPEVTVRIGGRLSVTIKPRVSSRSCTLLLTIREACDELDNLASMPQAPRVTFDQEGEMQIVS